MILTNTLIENSRLRLPENIDELIAKAKQPHSILSNPPEVLKKRSVLLTEANVPANIVRERILGANDLQEMNYFQRGIKAGNAVCRIVIKQVNGISYGTGFLICDSLIMTNNHVLESADLASNAEAEFDYELDEGNNYQNVTRTKITPDDFFYTNPDLDFTIVAISVPQPVRNKIRLINETGKAVYNESLSIIQHPDGREKKIAVRNNMYVKSTDTTLWYTTDTSPGSSGSPVFNDDWQLVALHHSGVPEQNSDGKYLLVDGTVVNSLDNIQESKIKWKANEGIRISSIVNVLEVLLTNNEFKNFRKFSELKDIYEASGLKNAAVNSVNIRPLKSESAPLLAFDVHNVVQKPSLDFNLQRDGCMQIIINVGNMMNRPELPYVPKTNGELMVETAKPKIKVVIDPNYNNREGYDSSFLNEQISLRRIVCEVPDKRKILLSEELKYEHFSIYMADSKWKMPYITAVNIDGARFVDYVRPADAWFPDPRAMRDEFMQLDNQVYKNNNLDKGHMIRREDPSWGTPDEALRATFDTYHYTNACPQHMKLNQGKMEWQGLENYILDLAIEKNLKITVFTGPVLQDIPTEYEEYRGVRVPMQFYKVVVVNNHNGDGVYSAGYVQSQYKHRNDFEAAYEPNVHQRSLKQIMELTALDLTPIIAVDTFDEVLKERRAQENSKRKGFVENYQSFRIQTLSDIALSLRERVF